MVVTHSQLSIRHVLILWHYGWSLEFNVVSQKWMETIGDLANNPSKLSTAPYNDGSLHWMNNDDNILSVAFPAVLRTSGKYARIGPYFNLKGEQDVKVNLVLHPTNNIFFFFFISIRLIDTFVASFKQDKSNFRSHASHHPFQTRSSRRRDSLQYNGT